MRSSSQVGQNIFPIANKSCLVLLSHDDWLYPKEKGHCHIPVSSYSEWATQDNSHIPRVAEQLDTSFLNLQSCLWD